MADEEDDDDDVLSDYVNDLPEPLLLARALKAAGAEAVLHDFMAAVDRTTGKVIDTFDVLPPFSPAFIGGGHFHDRSEGLLTASAARSWLQAPCFAPVIDIRRQPAAEGGRRQIGELPMCCCVRSELFQCVCVRWRPRVAARSIEGPS
jgi:hypothetical protein